MSCTDENSDLSYQLCYNWQNLNCNADVPFVCSIYMLLSHLNRTAGMLSNVQRWRRVSRQAVKYLAQWKTARCNFHQTVFHENSLQFTLTLKLENFYLKDSSDYLNSGTAINIPQTTNSPIQE